jgi:rhodanese-related sulfurtransferase
MTTEITRNALAEALLSRAPPVVLEALPRKYFDAGHIPTARAFPLEDLDRLAPRLAGDQQALIVVYCASATCANSHQAAERLQGLGYKNVAVYSGGKQDWQEAGLKLEI